MCALNLFNVTPQCSMHTMFVMCTDELFLGFETIYVLLLQGSSVSKKSWDILYYWFCKNAAQ
jgi:hypothetical protein